MPTTYKVPLLLTPQEEGGFVISSPVLPELLTEGETVDQALRNARDALQATLELYEELGRAVPSTVRIDSTDAPIWFEWLVSAR